ncbi:hypothetical protein Val02_72200 [Virgisporangium aliadipatigenens]|uniref:Uncharacterized protein n=1 Tax=Virgisporangium aliadipatigenens TaxID=741659 RepID=A0A8J4DU14_9ACTN|nr:hypothetical protein [Virgisporangium aliadipatigenens]GIJ50334.1 hypothetical protein Val02_72200 [Virgisporangium aliadipatigenens]
MSTTPQREVPSLESAGLLGILAQHDAAIGKAGSDWTSTTLHMMFQTGFRHVGGGTTALDRGRFNAEELAVYDWWATDVQPKAKWHALFDRYFPSYKAIEYSAYRFGADYVTFDGTGVPKPDVVDLNLAVYPGGDNSGRDLAVSTAALKYFASHLEAIVPPNGEGVIGAAIRRLGGINPRPGGFAVAEEFRRKLVGTKGEAADVNAGMSKDVAALLETVRHTLLSMHAGLYEVIRLYDTAEEFNAMTTADLDGVMNETWSQIKALDTHGRYDRLDKGPA